MPELVDTLTAIHRLHGASSVLRIFAAERFPIAAALTRICFINPERSDVLEDELCPVLDALLLAARRIDRQEGKDTHIQDDAKLYLEQWSSVRGAHWYSVHADPSGLRRYRLTPVGREAHTILASIEAGRSVATESRLKRFIDLANDLSARASGDPDRRITELKAQIARAEREIAEIERTGRVEAMPEREVIAEFEELLRLHGAIGADLDQVRALMAQHRGRTQDMVMTSDAPKGQLLDIVFAHEDDVRGTDEYASLDAFRQLLTDDQLRVSTRAKVDEIKRHPAIHARFIATGKAPARFDGAVESFFDRSRRIDAELTGYYEQLRGIVVREDIDEMRAVSRAHKALGARFVALRDHVAPSPRDARLRGVGIVLPGVALKAHPTADIRFPADLAARARPAPPPGIGDDESDSEAFARDMRREAHIAPAQLKLRIALARKHAGAAEVRLSEVLSLFPLRYGLAELNAYIELAVRHVPSRFDPALTAVARLTDEREDPVGLTVCTYFDPTFLADGEPGVGIEDIHCLTPMHPATDPAARVAMEEDALLVRLSAAIARAGGRERRTGEAG